ncbi:hypothetical protein ABQ438_25210, partial [Citrobacter freundii]
GKKSAQIREILISESAWEEMTCLFAPSLGLFWKSISDQSQHMIIDEHEHIHPAQHRSSV